MGNALRGRVVAASSPNSSQDFLINTTADGDQALADTLVLSDGRLLLTWTSIEGGGEVSIRARLIDPASPTAGSDLAVSTSAPDNYRLIDVLQLSAGKAVFVWETLDGANTVDAIHSRIIDFASPTSGADFRVDTPSLADISFRDLRLLDDGRLLFTWADDEGGSVRARIVSPSNPSGSSEITVNTTHSSGQYLKDIEYLSNGNILYVWDDSVGDGNGIGVRARIFNPDNPSLASDFLINTTLDGDQSFVSSDQLPDGKVLVIFADDSNGYSTYRYRLVDPVSPVSTVDMPIGDGIGAQLNLQWHSLGDGRISFTWTEVNNGTSSLRSSIYDTRASAVTLTGGAAEDSLVGTNFHDTLKGLGGNDALSAFDGNDILEGGEGSDRLDGGAGSDQMLGGSGNDTFFVDNANDAVVETAGAGSDTVYLNASWRATEGSEIEIIRIRDEEGLENIDITGNAHGNRIFGNAGVNRLSGGAATDALYGYDGDDRLNGGTGADLMFGGDGDDVYVVDNIDDAVFDGTGVDIVETVINYRLVYNIENLTLLGSLNINGTGNHLSNTILGNSGRNEIDGQGGADTMSGAAGNDVYFVDNLSDLVIEVSGGGVDLIKTSVSINLSGQVENGELLGSSALNIGGNALDNTIVGNAANNILNGASGTDRLFGLAGNDTYVVDRVSDFVGEIANNGTDLVRSYVAYTLSDNVET